MVVSKIEIERNRSSTSNSNLSCGACSKRFCVFLVVWLLPTIILKPGPLTSTEVHVFQFSYCVHICLIYAIIIPLAPAGNSCPLPNATSIVLLVVCGCAWQECVCR